MKEIQKLNIAFATTLKDFREKACLTQKELSEKIEGSIPYIKLLEAGKRQPTLTTFLLLAEALGITEQEFLLEIKRKLAFLKQEGN